MSQYPPIEGDDEVVAEYDVFLSTGLAGDVHVFQFPLRPFSRPYEASSIELFVSDGVAEVTKNNSAASGAPPAMGGLGGGPGATNLGGLGGLGSGGVTSGGGANPSATSRFHMKCTLDTYGSECFLPQSNRTEETQYQYEYALGSAPFSSRSSYAVGLLRDDAIHLCPVQSLQQFTPKVRSAVGTRTEVPPSDSPYEAVSAAHSSNADFGAAGGSQIRNRDRELVRATRSFMLNADAKTSQPLVFYPMGAPESCAKRNSLVCSTITPSAPKAGALQPTNTTDAFFPQDRLLDVSAEIAKKLVLRPGRHTRQEHIGDIVHSAQVITLDEVAEAMALCGFPGLKETDLVPLLREHAHYIYGAWVSRIPGVKISFPQLREVILAQFVASPRGSVRRATLNSLLKRNDPSLLANVLNVLNSIAELSDHSNPEERVWTFRKMGTLEEIEHFKQHWPQDFALQQQYWERRKGVVEELLNGLNMGRDGRGAGGVVAGAPRPAPPAGAAAPAGGASAAPAGGVAAAAGGAALPPGGAAQPGTQLEQWIGQIRSFVRSLFSEHGVIDKTQAKRLIQTRSRDPRCPFYNCSPEAMGTACKLELEGFTDSTFILQRANVPEIDTYRKYIVIAAKEKQQFQSADVVDRAQNIIVNEFSNRGSTVPHDMLPIPKAISQKIVSEIAVYQVGEKLWHLKRGSIDVQL